MCLCMCLCLHYARLRIHAIAHTCQGTTMFVTRSAQAPLCHSPPPLPSPQAGRQVRQSVERQRDLQPERSEEVPVCDAHSGRPRRKIAELSVKVQQCRGLPASSYENAGTVGNTDSYCVVKV